MATTLGVASFNIRNGWAFDGWNSWPLRRRSTLATIKALDADVLGLQESFRFQYRWIRKRLPPSESWWDGRGASGRGEG